MTLAEWQSKPVLCKWALEVFRSPEGQQFLAMMRESNVIHTQRLDLGNPSQNSADLGKIYGYEIALNNIQAATVFKKRLAPLEETFGTNPKP